MSLYTLELKAPEWLNEAYFECALAQYEHESQLKISKLEIAPACQKGDHFASLMFRVKLEYKRNTSDALRSKSLIVKIVNEADAAQQTPMFETEINMYAKTLPAIMEILSKHGASERFTPDLIYYALQPHTVIMLEDLCVAGYNVLRGRYNTLPELQKIFAKLAKLHAVSFMLGQSEESKQRELVTQYCNGLLCHKESFEVDMFATGIKKFIQLLKLHDEFQSYVGMFETLEKDLFAECQNLYCAYQQGLKNEIYVLNHGDFHMRNVLLKFDDKQQVENLMLIDFQLSVFAPSIVDLFYSAFLLLSPAAFLEQRDDLWHHYFVEFIATLKLIEYKGKLPKFADLQISAIRHRQFAVFILTTFMPLLISKLALDPEDHKADENDTDKLIVEDAKFRTFYYNPALLAEVRKLLPIFLRAGYLD